MTHAGKARFTVITTVCIRMEYSDTEIFEDEPSLFAVNRHVPFSDFTVKKEEEAMVIETNALSVTYRPDGQPFNSTNLKIRVKKGESTVEWAPGKTSRQNLGGTIRNLDRVRGPVMLGYGVLARDGWFLLDDSRRHLLVEGWVKSRPHTKAIDWFFFGYGLDYKTALKALTTVGGAVPLPRKYTLGSWYSRYWPYTSKEFRKIVDEYREHNFPLDVMVLDMDWHREGWSGWSWNRELLPDAEALLSSLHQQRLFVSLNLHHIEGVKPHEDRYPEFMKALGKDPSSKKTVKFDAGSQTYMNALFQEIHVPLEHDGVDFWWVDWQQDPDVFSVPRLPSQAWLNHCYYQHSGRQGLRGQCFSRWGGWGDHRYPMHFSGDAHTGWAMLAFEVPFTSTAGNMGCFYWSHDIGGHMGPRHEEAFVRWVQFGAMSAALRLHSTRSADLDRRPWTYSRKAEDAMRQAFHLRSELFPYIYSAVRQGHTESLPLVRPMYLEYPEAEDAYHHPQQYLFGDAFLAAPITSPGQGPEKRASRQAWIPEGRWYNWFTHERFQGPKKVKVTCGLDTFPLWARGGVPIPMQPYTERMTTEPLTTLRVRCFPGEDGKKGESELYEDDGVTQEYLKGAYAVTTLSYERQGRRVTVTIGPAEGRFEGQERSRAFIIEFPGTPRSAKASVNGRPIHAAYEAPSRTNFIHIPTRPVEEGVTVVLESQP